MNELQIQRVWEGLLLSEMRALYFAEPSARYSAHQRYITWAILVTSSAAFVAVVGTLPDRLWWARPLLTFATAALSYYLLGMQNQKRAEDAAELYRKWSQLAAEYQAIWENVYVDNAPRRLNDADVKAIELSKAGLHLPNDQGRVKHWQDFVEANWAARTGNVAHAA